jgi:hypothetical protein
LERQQLLLPSAALNAHHVTSWHQSMQQQQQLQCLRSAYMGLEQLQQLLLAFSHDTSGTAAASAMTPFKLWAAAVGSSNVATLLRQPRALLQLMQRQAFTAATAAGYIGSVERVLTLPGVAGLLSAAELASLLQQLCAAKDAWTAGVEATGIAAPDAAAVQHSNHAANGQQQQVQQQQVERVSTLDLQQLQEVLSAFVNYKTRLEMMLAFMVWSKACSSVDVSTMLRQPGALLQALQQYTPATAIKHLRRVRAALQLPAFAALLPPAELASLLQQLLEGVQRLQHPHQQADGASAINLQQLQGVLSAYHRGKSWRAKSAMHPFNVWSDACGSTDVTTMLQQPAALLQALQKHKANTAAGYLSNVLAVLQMPAVAALLPPSETAALLQQLQEAVQEYRTLPKTRRLSKTQRSLTADTPAMAGCVPSAEHQQQCQQQEQEAQQHVALATHTAQQPAALARPASNHAEHAAVLSASLAELQQQLALDGDASNSNSQEQQHQSCCAGDEPESMLFEPGSVQQLVPRMQRRQDQQQQQQHCQQQGCHCKLLLFQRMLPQRHR